MKCLRFIIPMLIIGSMFLQTGCEDEPVDCDNPPCTGDTTDTTCTNPPCDTTDTTVILSYCVPQVSTTQTTPWPEWIFYHWVWEDESTQQSAQALIDDYLAHDIPVHAIIIDSPWETGYNTGEWDNNLYPDPQAMVNYMHDKDVRVVVWITGIMNDDVQPQYDFGKNNNYYMKLFDGASNPQVVNWWKGDGSLIDYFNQDAVDWWKTIIDPCLDYGIDGWKCDGTDFSAITAPYSPGQGANVTRNEYSHAYYRMHHDYSRQRLGDDRVVFGRPIDNYGTGISGDAAAFMPKDIAWATWVGDQDATFEGMRSALNSMYESAEYGYLSFGSDIGGYREESAFPGGRSKEVFIRWAGLGTFSPIMENGGGGEHRPWMFDTETEKTYRRLVRIRYCMIDYLMQEAQYAWNNSISMVDYFNKTDYSYLLGREIFVAPIITAGNDIDVNFPAGDNWVYLFDQTQTYTGGSMQSLTIPITEYPVFIKAGSTLLTDIKVPGLDD